MTATAEPARSGQGRAVRLLMAIGLAVVLGVSILTVLVLFESRAKDIADTERELSRLDVSLSEQSARSFQSVDLILDSVVEQLRNAGITTTAEFAEKMAGRDTYELLRAKIAGVPQLDAVTLIAADGHLINFSRYFPTPPVVVLDRDYFIALKDHPSAHSFLSAPMRNRGTGTRTIYLARRVNDPAGHFIGLVLGAVNLDYFQGLYHALLPTDDGTIALWRRDGTLLTRYPKLADDKPVTASPGFHRLLASGDAAVYETPNSLDGAARIVATHAVRGYPVDVSITRTMRRALAGWRHEAAVIVVAGAICITAVALVFWMLVRLFRSYEGLSRAVAQREEAIRARELAEAQVSHLVKIEALGQLTGGIAHDFNNLLTVIIGNLELLKVRFSDCPEELARLIDTAMRGAERGATMTHRLLAFSRRQPLAPQLTDANRLIAGMSDLLQRTLGENITVETVLAGGLWGVDIDPNQLESALLNLAVNARDAMPGGGKLTIETANTTLDRSGTPPDEISGGDYAVISISDIGIGMTKEIAGRVFEPFFTTKEPGRGTGLGLSQVYGFIKQSGGHIRIDSAPGAGTTVHLYLPRRSAPPAPMAAPSSSLAAAPATQGHEAILVVEDEEDVRSYSCGVLRDLGYRVFEAASADAALVTLAERQEVQLLFTDIGLPGGLNGRELAAAARRRRPGLRVLLTTGYAGAAFDGRDGMGAGMELVTKPFSATLLAATVRRILGEQRETAS